MIDETKTIQYLALGAVAVALSIGVFLIVVLDGVN